MKFTRKTWLAIAAGALLASPAAIAADHTDGTQASANSGEADITDLFTWMTDATHLTLIMDVTKAASTASLFSDTVKYVFHTTAHGPAAAGTPLFPIKLGGTSDSEVDVICTFAGTANPQTISCWLGDGNAATGGEYVTGPASMGTPLKSADGKMTVYAGLAADPFFFNLEGFQEVAGTVTAVKGNLQFDAAGCPLLTQGLAGDAGYAGILYGELTTSDGGTPVDSFAGLNVLAIVVQVDTSLLIPQPATGAPTDTLVSVWASTNN